MQARAQIRTDRKDTKAGSQWLQLYWLGRRPERARQLTRALGLGASSVEFNPPYWGSAF